VMGAGLLYAVVFWLCWRLGHFVHDKKEHTLQAVQ